MVVASRTDTHEADATTATAPTSPLTRLGFAPGQVVQEIGFDDDVDQALRTELESLTGHELVDTDFGDVVDAVILWFRDEDGDLTDAVVDALTDLEDQGFVLALTPKAGRDGHVAPSEVSEAATTSGLHVAGTLASCANWTGTRLAPPKNARR